MSHTDTAPKTDPKTGAEPDAATGPQTSAQTDTTTSGEAKRGRKAGSTVKRPDTSVFDLEAIAGAVAAPAEVREAAAPRQERSPQQLAMDKVVVRAHKAWVDAGRPAAWPKMPVITYYLDPTHVEGYKYLIRKGADFAGFRPKFGSPARVTRELIGALAKKGVNIPAEFEGREVLAWAVIDKRANTRSADAKPDTKPDESKTDAKPGPAAK